LSVSVDDVHAATIPSAGPVSEVVGPVAETLRFATRDIVVTEGSSAYVSVYGGSEDRTTAAKVTLVKNTYTATPKVYMTVDGVEKKVKFPLTLDWKKGECGKKTFRLEFAAKSKVEVDKFFTLQLGSEVASITGPLDVCRVTVVDRGNTDKEDLPYVRALAWPANGGKANGSGYVKKPTATRTLSAKANKWALFAGWYKADPNAPNEIARASFVSNEAKLKVGWNDTGTYYAYFTNVTAVIAVDDPDFGAEDVIGIATNAEGVATCMTGFNVSFTITNTVDAASKPKLTVSKLPAGLKFNRKTYRVTGVPKKSGTYTVKVTGRNTAGTHTLYFTIKVEDMPAECQGTFTGNLVNGESVAVGLVEMKVKKDGGVSVSVTYEGKKYAFSGKGLGGYVLNESGYDVEYDFVAEKKNTGTVKLMLVPSNPFFYRGIVSGEKFGEEPLFFWAIVP